MNQSGPFQEKSHGFDNDYQPQHTDSLVFLSDRETVTKAKNFRKLPHEEIETQNIHLASS